MSDVVAVRYPVPDAVRTADVVAKGLLLLLLAIALVRPDLGNMEGKAGGLRAVAYPALAFAIPLLWVTTWRERASFPWVADLLVTVTCFTDTLGNRLDLYDTIVWFDDWMHFMNTGLLAAAVILLTLHRTAGLAATIERGLSFGVTAAVGWEIAEYFAFLSTSDERAGAYADTLGDLALGTLGSLLAAVVIHRCWQAGMLRAVAPQLELAQRAPDRT